ncbi:MULTISPECIES: hypothetical protein [Paenibacillus]|uniref:hypothetical protein n=1 Tax=Paenibacillus TaxID=44249 RepID=UPI000B838D39|nr:hypothetical protein [Paenibacillus amylolyticus]
MRIINLSTGEIEIIKDDEELIGLVKDHMGTDMSSIISELIGKSEYNKMKLESDLLSYESSLEDSRGAFIEMREELLKISSEVKKSRINKRQILEQLNQINFIVSEYI